MRFLKFFFLLPLFLITGCTTFLNSNYDYYGPVNSAHNTTSVLFDQKIVRVKLKYFSNYDTYDRDVYIDKRNALKSALRKQFKNQDRNLYFIEFTENVDEYLEVSFIYDQGFDNRVEQGGVAKGFLAILSGLSLMIIPGMDLDYDQYIFIRHIKDGKEINKWQYKQGMTRYYSLLFLPLSPFYTVNNGVDRSLEKIFKDFSEKEGI